MNTNHKKFLTNRYFLVFLLVELLIMLVVWRVYFNYGKNYETEIIDKIDTIFHSTISGYTMVAQTLYEEVINTPKIINIFKQAHKANLQQQINIRQQLFDELNPTYQRLRQKNLRQLHFHLPDNTSFLRFHKPEKFGDNLSDIRYSVFATNLYKKPAQGFEEGRIFNGFRYVFPLFDQNQHIGSVETSISFDALRNEIRKIYGLDYDLMLRKEVVAKKLFRSELDSYQICELDQQFLCETDKIRQHESEQGSVFNKIRSKMRYTVSKELNSNEAFIKFILVNNNFYEVAFYPIENVERQKVAYVVSYNQNNRLYYLKSTFIFVFIGFSFTNILFFILIYHKNRMNKLILDKNRRLTKLNYEKNEFLGIAAHDLKNPLQAIQGSAEIIKMILTETGQHCDQKCKSELIEFSQMIIANVERMFSLITNLLDVNAIESGKMKLHLQVVDILPILQAVVSEYQQKAKSKNISIHFTSQQQHYFAYVDIEALYQVLDNLVSNAVKYSPHGKQIYVQICEREKQMRIEVQDQGCGIAQEEQKKLFGKFARLGAKPTGDEHSTGLGLFIVKKLVDAMKGQVWCESEQGQGACFISEFSTIRNE